MATTPFQYGTGLHIDVNGYNIWAKEMQDGTFTELDRFRLFQSYLACSANSKPYKGKDGGMLVVPGFHLICESYFAKTIAGKRYWFF